MSVFRLHWLFEPPSPAPSPAEIIAWWERRRIPYNLIVFGVGILAFVVYCVSINATGVLPVGEDIVEPIAWFILPWAVPLVVNLCYTAGWMVDVPLRWFFPTLSLRFTPGLFALGFVFSIFLVTLPAVFWSAYLVLQWLGVLA